MNEYGCRIARLINYDIMSGNVCDGHYKLVQADNMIFAAKDYIKALSTAITFRNGDTLLIKDDTGYIHNVKIVDVKQCKVQIVNGEELSQVY